MMNSSNLAEKQNVVFNQLSRRKDVGSGQRLWDNIVHQVVRKKLSEKMPIQVRGSYIYEFAAGWESKVIRKDPDVVTLRDISSLRRAMANPDTKYIFVPSTAALTRAHIEEVCESQTLAKTIFYERGQNNG